VKEITLQTTIADLLNNYDNMKEILIDINPKFKKLNNPILRRTLAKLATVKQAAVVGGMKPYDLLNKLRSAVGQEPLENIKEDENSDTVIPQWAKNPANMSLNVNELLDNNKNPLAEANRIVKKLKKEEILEIVSDFKPEPLIEEFQKHGFEVSSYKEDEEIFITKIKK